MGVDGDPSDDVPDDNGTTGTGRSERSPIILSTGQTVHLPLETEATIFGAVYAAPDDRVAAMVPDGVQPIRVTPRGKAAIMLLSVEYHHVGVEGIEPYDEFAVVVPAARGRRGSVPILSSLAEFVRNPGGYVWFLPVTTEPAKALGVDVWEFPKVVGEISHEDEGSTRHTTVTIDGERFVELAVDRGRTVGVEKTVYSYAVRDGDVLQIPVEVDAKVGGWPLTTGVSLSLGEDERADALRGLGLGGRALGRFVFEGSARFGASESIGGV